MASKSLDVRLGFSKVQTFLNLDPVVKIISIISLIILGGLIQVSGSASFVRDSSALSTDETFTLAFLSTAYNDIIPTSTTITYPKVCNHKATHVVNKIVYGQNAYFFFKYSKRSSSQNKDVSGSLQAAVKAIPGFSIEGSGKVVLTDQEKELRESTEVRFNGDFNLKNVFPTTYNASINAFKKLSGKLWFQCYLIKRITYLGFKSFFILRGGKRLYFLLLTTNGMKNNHLRKDFFKLLTTSQLN